MKREKIFKVMAEYKKTLEDKGYNVIYIGLYGSQNYNLDDELSDIDCKAIILPTLHDIIFRKITSATVECEKGNIDVKDLVTFYDVIKKGNFSYIESIDTEYFIGDKYIKDLFKQFRPNSKSILGAMYEKRKALTHEFPSKTEEFKKWGCDPKQFHHIIRLYNLLDFNLRYKESRSYLEYDEADAKKMIAIKRNSENLTKKYMEQESDNYINSARELIDYNYTYEYKNIDDEINAYIEKKVKLELLNNSEYTYAREYRTFGKGIPKKDLEKFECLKDLKEEDISYIIVESIEIL